MQTPPPTSAMPAPIEARSMASLTALANSPPTRRPDFQVSFERKGILLWIVRVPEKKGDYSPLAYIINTWSQLPASVTYHSGDRGADRCLIFGDIILTPIHPARSSHTATRADIEACLYYLHLHESSSSSRDIPTVATLIRRYPAEGSQWDVANIVVPEMGREEARIEMLGEGYRVFGKRSALTPPTLPRTPAVAGAGFERKPVPFAQKQQPGEPLPLIKVMHMEGEGFWDRVKGRRKKSESSRPIDRTPTPEVIGGGSGRTKKKRDYVFDGLWTDTGGASCGRCEFKEERTGKYIKVLHDFASSTHPPLSVNSVFQCKYYPADTNEKSTLLSVMEFKPPSALGHHVHHRQSSDEKAKMGMLIVHGPGQDMLDLLVAANIARQFRELIS